MENTIKLLKDAANKIDEALGNMATMKLEENSKELYRAWLIVDMASMDLEVWDAIEETDRIADVQ